MRSIAALDCNIYSQITVAQVTLPKAVLNIVRTFTLYKIKLTTMQVIAIISHGSMNPGFFLITPKSMRLLIKMLQPELIICTVKTQGTSSLMKSNFCQYASYCSITSGEVGLSS